jgi:hypothetical protein
VRPVPRQKGHIWTAEDDDRLKTLIEANLSIHLIAAKMKRTTQGVRYRASTLGISIKRVWVGLKAKGKVTGPKHVGRRWTRAEEKQLQDMLDAGMTAGEAATKLERTRQSIYARLQRLYRKRVKPSPAWSR